MTDPFVAIQINATSFVDEGVNPVLDILQEKGNVNALLLANPTWTRGVGGRQVPGHPLPDHGVQEYDNDYWGGQYAVTHPEYFGGTIVSPVARPKEFTTDFDVLGDVIPEAQSRGMKSYAWMDESSYVQAFREIPNMPKTLEVDVWNRPSTRPCFNNPDYRNWWLSIVEDTVKSYDIDGMAFCSERPGPLNTALQGSSGQGGGTGGLQPEALTCFCEHCKKIARDRGYDPERAQRGYREVLDWSRKVASGMRPSDGAFISFWRLLLNYPELLAWQSLWTDSQHQLYRDMYGVAKASNQNVQVGWHVYHNISWSPFFRADQDYAKYAEFSDFLKVVAYDNCGGPRFAGWIKNISNAIFADFDADEVYPIMLKLLDLDEGALADIPKTGLSADYVKRETARAVRSAGNTRIYTGIDVDIPVGTTPEAVADRAKRFEGGMGANRSEGLQSAELTNATPLDELAACTPESVKAAVLGAFDGGAQGVILSRKYSEMKLANLGGAGAAIDELKAR